SEEQRKQAIVALGFIVDQEAVNAMQEVMASGMNSVREQALWWLRYRRDNDWGDFDIQIPELVTNISPALQKEMLDLRKVLESTESSLEEKIKASNAMAGDKTGGEMLIGLAAEGKLPKEIIAAVSKEILKNPEQSIRVLAADYFKSGADDAAGSVAEVIKTSGNREQGKAIFRAKCATCHRVGTEGLNIGPDLSMIGAKFDKTGLLDAIINPSAGMAFGYEMWLITKKDGTTATGFLQADGETVVLKGMNNELYPIKADDIASRKQFSTSIMPEPAALGLDEADLADQSEYL